MGLLGFFFVLGFFFMLWVTSVKFFKYFNFYFDLKMLCSIPHIFLNFALKFFTLVVVFSSSYKKIFPHV